MNEKELREFRERFKVPISDDVIVTIGTDGQAKPFASERCESSSRSRSKTS